MWTHTPQMPISNYLFINPFHHLKGQNCPDHFPLPVHLQTSAVLGWQGKLLRGWVLFQNRCIFGLVLVHLWSCMIVIGS
jgi:hypothetical protein